ncbi:mkk7 [Aphelenchoides avenae]|nr:mkk7 [Aphelenchus avenae]
MKRTQNYQEAKRTYMDLDVIRNSHDCRYIVQCFGFILTADHLYICMEHMATCLDKLLDNKFTSGFPEEIIGKVTVSVVHALNYLKEKHSVMHRDVKPSNILLDWHGNVKLCDFGIAGQLIDSKAATMSLGCIAYLAASHSSEAVLRITLVHLATGKLPYGQNTNPFFLMAHIKQADPPRLADPHFTPELHDFVHRCLQKELEKRPKYKDLLQHQFLLNAEHEDVDVGLWFTQPKQYEELHRYLEQVA